MGKVRDPEAKKRALLDAALAEFADNGFTGTSTDAIGRRAGCSAGLIYTYFGSKEGIFAALFDEIVTQVTTTVPFTPNDLPGYAVRLFDLHGGGAPIMRIAKWHTLERERLGLPATLTPQATREQIAQMQAALDAGTVRSPLDAGQLVLLVQTIALAWVTNPDDLTAVIAGDDDLDRRRATITQAVRRLLDDPVNPQVD